jgi:NADH dehydrogenase FAD-containing subunit
MPESAINAAVKELTKLGVEIQNSTSVISTSQSAAGKTIVKTKNLKDGLEETIEVDLYLNSIGTIKNGEWLPKELKNEKGEVVVDEFLKVKGLKNVWAAGDITSLQPDSIMYAGKYLILPDNSPSLFEIFLTIPRRTSNSGSQKCRPRVEGKGAHSI